MTDAIAGPHGNIEVADGRLDDLLNEFFRLVVEALLERRAAGVKPYKAPCHGCGLNPATWKREGPEGFDSTMVRLWRSLEGDGVFICHADLPRDADGEWIAPANLDDADLCANWVDVEPFGAGLMLKAAGITRD